ncbi:unnamed protein product [Heterobilharzia americana]|nr:unnamed protein product [Heterobilharzia americana]
MTALSFAYLSNFIIVSSSIHNNYFTTTTTTDNNNNNNNNSNSNNNNNDQNKSTFKKFPFQHCYTSITDNHYSDLMNKYCSDKGIECTPQEMIRETKENFINLQQTKLDRIHKFEYDHYQQNYHYDHQHNFKKENIIIKECDTEENLYTSTRWNNDNCILPIEGNHMIRQKNIHEGMKPIIMQNMIHLDNEEETYRDNEPRFQDNDFKLIVASSFDFRHLSLKCK